MPLSTFGELQGGHLHYPILLGGVGDMNTFVDGQTSDLTEIVVGVGPDGANTVGAEGETIRVSTVYLREFVFANHVFYNGEGG